MMDNNKLANRVIELRKRQGFSQEFLAEESGVSLRTMQRVENGETKPRGDTLQRIAKGLGITSEELIGWKLDSNTSYLSMLNGSALSFLLFPILGILVPLVMWISKRKKIRKVDEYGKEIINFQITWCFFIFLIYISYVISIIFRVSILPRFTPAVILSLVVFVGVLYLLNIILILMNSVRIIKGKNPTYLIRIPFLR